jgi:hypothetical protein
MKPITVLVPYAPTPAFRGMLNSWGQIPLIEEIRVISPGAISLDAPKCVSVIADNGLTSGETLNQALAAVQTRHLLLLPKPRTISFSASGLEKMIETMKSNRAGMVYSDLFMEDEQGGRSIHPLNDYQVGSVRDDFDFGPVMLFSSEAIKESLWKYGGVSSFRSAGLYDLRLKISMDWPVYHIQEPLCTETYVSGASSDAQSLFSYVDPRNAQAQKEMESVFTEHLKRTRAFVPPENLRNADPVHQTFPVVASVIIPVRNRVGTIGDAVRSALSQITDFPFNVIVVDNHSTDGTTAVLADLATRHGRLLEHIVPDETDLAIGGCWNEGINSPTCGRFAVQLDSDDLYGSSCVLQTIVDMLRGGGYAMVVGSYTLVDERLEEIPPGLIDHAEWTDANGHNNALRINGLGAPRAFDTALMRKIEFLNVSYGEDYAAALRICREYRIGRIFESLYLCRRWAGNTDAALSIEDTNKNNAFKDSIRTEEIRARKHMNRYL